MQNKVVFELGHKPKFFIPELIARIVLTTFICITYTNFNQRDNLVLECLSFCILMNVVISFISLNDESIFYWVFSKIFKRKAQDNTIFAS